MITTKEVRVGYRLQTGYGHVRCAPFSDDVLVSLRDLRGILAESDVTPDKVFSIIEKHHAAHKATTS
jgi:hypothetical protein